MIMFIMIAIGLLLWSTFGNEGLIFLIKAHIGGPRPIVNILKTIGEWLCGNVVCIMLNAIVVWVCSFLVFAVFTCTGIRETTQYEFNINALQDNIVTEGTFYGRRGNVDGELSYFFSRTMVEGEKIGHIPADKTYIRYDSDERPHIEVCKSYNDYPEWVRKVFWFGTFDSEKVEHYVIVVPEGTITNTGEYTIDMQ